MGRPHDTVDVPGHWPAVFDEVIRVLVDDDHSAELRRLLSVDVEPAARGSQGHVCSTAWVLSPDCSRILLVEHPRLGWSNPGGHLHPHETSLAAARRELAEECGAQASTATLVIDRPTFVHVTEPDGVEHHRHWNLGWLFTLADDIALTGTEPAQWWPRDRLPDVPLDVAVGLARIDALM